jgi:hypothetical protein
MTARPIVLVVGAASRDVVADDPRGWRLGGAVTFASLALARFGFEVWALVGADAEAAGAAELDLLRSAGVSMAIAPLASGPVFDNVRHILHTTSDQVPVTALPRRWTSGFDGVLFVPVAAELGDDWAMLAGGNPTPVVPAPVVGLGWQGLLRWLVAGDLVRPAQPTAPDLARAARLVVMSREDAVAGTTPQEMLTFLDPAATVVWTEGADGGQVLRSDGDGGHVAERYPAIPSGAIVDPTGAGDVFLAGWLAATITPAVADPDSALTFAAAAASLTIEGPGLLGVPDLAAVRARAERARMTRAPSRASRRPSAVSSRGRGRPSQA